MTKERVDCQNCSHFRSAPYEARIEGCYFAGNMKVKQKESYLDEQQLPGNHKTINRDGDCPDFAQKQATPSIWRRLLGA